jgi:hypothetical protein
MLAPAQEQRDAAACGQTGGASAKTTGLARRETIRSIATVRPRVLFAACITAFVLMLMPGARADLRKLPPDQLLGGIEVFISGTITERDAKVFEALSEEVERSLLRVRLDSIGGDVDAAMRIGRLVRKYEGSTSIGKEPSSSFNANCYSSCALIFIAGVWRSILSPGGQLGLHRPYLASAPQNRDVVEKQVPLMLSQVREYITEMGVTENFYQLMVNTEPSKMLVYGNPNIEFRELNTELGTRTIVNNWTRLVPEYDPVYQEITTSYDARKYGVTTLEMRKRDSDAEGCSKRKGAEYFSCAEAVRWGLSERVYVEREKQAEASCWHDEDHKFLLTIPTKERRDHPMWIKRETCVRNIMLGRS